MCSSNRPSARQAATGSALPFSSSGSSGTYSTTLPVARRVRSPTVIVPGLGARLQSRGDVDGVPDHRVGVADPAREDLTGVDAHTQRELDAIVGEQTLVELAHRRLHADRRAHRALGVVLVRDRRAEDRHHVVAHVLVHPASDALDLLAQTAQAPVHERLDRLGIEALGDRRVAGQVGEQHGDRAPLLARRLASASTPPDCLPCAWAPRRRRRSSHSPRAAPTSSVSIGVPQATQKRASASAGAPHAGQLCSSLCPQAMQNCAVAGFSALHFPQVRVCGIAPSMMTTAERRQGRESYRLTSAVTRCLRVDSSLFSLAWLRLPAAVAAASRPSFPSPALRSGPRPTSPRCVGDLGQRAYRPPLAAKLRQGHAKVARVADRLPPTPAAL